MFYWNEGMGLSWNVKRNIIRITAPFRNFFKWVVKSICYSIVLWNDRDYDYNNILRMLRYKIYRTRKCLHKNKLNVYHELVNAEMEHAEALIKQLEDDDFLPELDEAHEKKWGALKRVERENISGIGPTYSFIRENATTPELIKQEKEELEKMSRAQSDAYAECYDELFRHLKTYLTRWWD